MYYQGLTWKFKLLLMSGCLVIGPLVLFLFHKEHGHLPNIVIIGVIIASIFSCLLIVLGDRSWRKYFMNQEASHDNNDEQ